MVMSATPERCWVALAGCWEVWEAHEGWKTVGVRAGRDRAGRHTWPFGRALVHMPLSWWRWAPGSGLPMHSARERLPWPAALHLIPTFPIGLIGMLAGNGLPGKSVTEWWTI